MYLQTHPRTRFDENALRARVLLTHIGATLDGAQYTYPVNLYERCCLKVLRHKVGNNSFFTGAFGQITFGLDSTGQTSRDESN